MSGVMRNAKLISSIDNPNRTTYTPTKFLKLPRRLSVST